MTNIPSGTIEIDGLRIQANHGVETQETIVGNTFEVSVKLRFDAEHAMRTDRIDLTLNYADIVALVREEMKFPSKLLEHVVFRIYQNITHRYTQVSGGEISVYKLNPPIPAELNRVGFTFRW
ncbi:MAG: dihydroneopterin aldolase [Muribaculaceae bacterium]|nr:dihydroneopterin aldolase [Muribaculaceae bacterium]